MMSTTTAPLRDAPSRLAAPDFGLYRGAIAEGPPTPSIRGASMRRKQWIYVGVCDPAWVAGFAIAQLGYVANAFAYVGDVGGRGPLAWKTVAPPWAAAVDRRRASVRAGRDAFEIVLPTATSDGHVRGALRASGETATFALDLKRHASGAPEVTCVAPAGDDARGRWNLTVKDNAVAASGTIRWGSREYKADGAALVDVTDAYAPRHTAWHWASCAGRDAHGRAVGVNLCALHNDSERARENVLWVDGEPHALGAAHFEFDRANPGGAPWTISGDGIALRFDPSGLRDGRENMLLVRSRFVQPYGVFRGTVTAAGVTATLDGVTGVVEDHDAVW